MTKKFKNIIKKNSQASVGGTSLGEISTSSGETEGNQTTQQSGGFVWRKKEKNRLTEDQMKSACLQYQSGVQLNNIAGVGGELLNSKERSLVKKRTKTDDTVSFQMGRRVHPLVNGGVRDGTYMCDKHLAGTCVFLSPSGLLGKLPIVPIAQDCGNQCCIGQYELRAGGKYDGICVYLPQEPKKLQSGYWPVEECGSIQLWQDNYPRAVQIAIKLRELLSITKRTVLYGVQFNPRSLYQEAILVLCRMAGLQNISVFHYAESPDMFTDVLDQTPGSNKCAGQFYQRNVHRVMKMSNYAWSFYHVCRVQAMFPDVAMPLQWYTENIDRVVTKKISTITKKYQDLFFEENSYLSCLELGQDVMSVFDDELCADQVAVGIVPSRYLQSFHSDFEIERLLDGSGVRFALSDRFAVFASHEKDSGPELIPSYTYDVVSCRWVANHVDQAVRTPPDPLGPAVVYSS